MQEMESTHILQTRLEEYSRQALYPLHMPGHKRRMEPAPGLPYTWDVTEVPGTDDLHDAHGILRDAMERTASLFGAERTWYLVNGSTCGLLAGIRALAPRASEILCARNCHKAVYHALELSGYRVHWILPPVDPEWEICGGISASQVAKELMRHPGARALILTSPTYEGVLSEVREICRICHERDIPVLVDEAHGAHLLPMAEQAGFPQGALACGADLVVQSPHKTLPSMTQTALLHLQGGLVDPDRIVTELDIFETSSPSYPLLASLDGCTGLLRDRGRILFEQWAARLGRFERKIRSLQRLRVLYHLKEKTQDNTADAGTGLCLAGFDPGKILIHTGGTGMTGEELADLLRNNWQLETEMTQGNLVLAMTSVCDAEDALDRLAEALIGIDGEYEGSGRSMEYVSALGEIRPSAACTLAEAAGQDAERVPFSAAAGRICAEYLYFYPPGIPVLAPGEVIRDAQVDLIRQASRAGAVLYRHEQDEMIRCLRE